MFTRVKHSSTHSPFGLHQLRQTEGIKAGFIGMTLETTDTLVAAAGIQGYNFLDEAETANKLVPILRRRGVRTISCSCTGVGRRQRLPVT